ncbi:hypothetical protein CDPAHKCJ_02634 [Cobetia sp. MB87]|nr:hypothetical protein [Cobetia sp. MB87]
MGAMAPVAKTVKHKSSALSLTSQDALRVMQDTPQKRASAMPITAGFFHHS